MSSRRRRSALKLTPDEISDLVLKLQALLPDSSSRCTSEVPASKTLEETCNYIKMLHSEVDDLSEKLSQKLASTDSILMPVIETLRHL
uniref:Transcription factor ILI6-like n=2 Tax=Nicotiana TaxID=4085 RepID=A0A1S3XJB1_TOBAC|nr:PREDICTED: transcription factor ILI6-like [Nicotiana tabacum]